MSGSPLLSRSTAALGLALLLAACGSTPPQQANQTAPNQTASSPATGSIEPLALPTSGTEYVLRNQCSGKALEIANSAMGNYGNAWQGTQYGTEKAAPNQRWTLQATDSGYYKLIATHSGLVLDVDGAGTTNGSNVQQFTYNNLANQQWAFIDAGNGYYSLRPRHTSAMRLDVNGASLADHANVQLWQTKVTCAQLWRLEPTNVVYSAPLIITQAGTYSGNWASDSSGTAAIDVQTSAPVIIENCNIRSRSTLIRAMYNNVHLTVRNCNGYGLNPLTTGKTAGMFVKGDEFNSLTIENNYLEGTSGIQAQAWEGTAAAGDTVTIRYNRVKNIEGRYSNGAAGGWIDSNTNQQYEKTHFVFINQAFGLSNTKVGWNAVKNEPNQSRPEDVINIHESSGTATSPISVFNNLIDGAYGTPTTGAYFGGGILLGDGCGASRYQEAYGNTVLETSNHGISVVSGTDMSIRNNTVLGTGKLGSLYLDSGNEVAIYLRQYCGGASTNVVAQNNTVGWGVPESLATANDRNDLSNNTNGTPNTGTFLNNTHVLPYDVNQKGAVNPQLLLDAAAAWETSRINAGFVVGPR